MKIRIAPVLGLLAAAVAVGGGMALLIGGPSAPAAAPGSQKDLPSPTLNYFEKSERTELFDLKYRWKNFDGATWELIFPFSKAVLAESEREFGYTQAELEAFLTAADEELRRVMIGRLKEFVRGEFERARYGKFMSIVERDDLTFNMKFAAPEEERSAVRAEFQAISARLAKRQEKEREEAVKEIELRRVRFLENRGLRVLPEDHIGINYALVAERNRARVRHVFQALRDVRKGARLQEFLSVLVAFVQEIRYGLPALVEDGKHVLGFWVPPRVLVGNYGDCDSKGVAFASLWSNFKDYPIVLIKIPDHMLVGVAMPSLNEEGTIIIRGLRYTLCEVTGPGKLPPGWIMPYTRPYLQSGRYSYEIVP